MGEYGETNTPLEFFDSECHKQGLDKIDLLDDSKVRFMIYIAENAGRPTDMLMLLGEYFKQVIIQSNDIAKNRLDHGKKDEFLDKFIITPEILNSLGTACKMYIEAPIAQLRLSIALVRSPAFNTKTQTQADALKKNIKKC